MDDKQAGVLWLWIRRVVFFGYSAHTRTRASRPPAGDVR